MAMFNIKNIYEWPLSRQILILGLICAITFYLGYLWDLSSLKQNMDTIQQQENDLKQQLGMNINKGNKLKEDIKLFPALQHLLQQWQSKINQQNKLPELLNEILKVGSNNRLYFASFNPGEKIREGAYIKIPIKVVAVGSYHQLADFISQVANLNSIVVVSDFNISNENKNDVLGTKLAKQANEQNLLTAELTLEIYNVPEQGELLEVSPSTDTKTGKLAPAKKPAPAAKPTKTLPP